MTTEPEEERPRPKVTLQNRMKMFPVVATTEDRLKQVRQEIINAAMQARSPLDLQILHAKMDDLLKFDD